MGWCSNLFSHTIKGWCPHLIPASSVPKSQIVGSNWLPDTPSSLFQTPHTERTYTNWDHALSPKHTPALALATFFLSKVLGLCCCCCCGSLFADIHLPDKYTYSLKFSWTFFMEMSPDTPNWLELNQMSFFCAHFLWSYGILRLHLVFSPEHRTSKLLSLQNCG